MYSETNPVYKKVKVSCCECKNDHERILVDYVGLLHLDVNLAKRYIDEGTLLYKIHYGEEDIDFKKKPINEVKNVWNDSVIQMRILHGKVEQVYYKRECPYYLDNKVICNICERKKREEQYKVQEHSYKSENYHELIGMSIDKAKALLVEKQVPHIRVYDEHSNTISTLEYRIGRINLYVKNNVVDRVEWG